MTESSYKAWHVLNDQALLSQIGAFVKHHRLEQNRTQASVAHAAGISRSTLSLLERGETVTLTTLIQVLRVLDLLHVMDGFAIEQRISPLALARAERQQRKRGRSSGTQEPERSPW